MKELIYLPIIALMAASISFTITSTKMFLGFRNTVGKLGKWFKDLVSCPYCFGHWVVFIILLILPKKYIIHWINIPNSYLVSITNFIFTSFVIIGLMGLVHYFLIHAYEQKTQTPAQALAKKFEQIKQQASIH